MDFPFSFLFFFFFFFFFSRSTYNESWFLKRHGYHVATSQAVHWGAYATQGGVGAKECLLHLALIATRRKGSEITVRPMEELVSIFTFN
jgi:hypothetical protein